MIADEPNGSGVEVLKLLSVLWRRRWTVLGSTALFLTTAIFATLMLPAQYTAQTQVIVESEDSATSLLNDLGLSEMAMSLTTASDEIQNKIYLATSQPIVDEVIWKLQLRNGAGELYQAEDVVEAGLLSPITGTPSITVTQTQGTDVLVIETIGPTAEAARLMADTLAEVYIERQTASSRAEYAHAKTFIEQQLGIVTDELEQSYGELAEVQRQTDVIDLDSEQRAAVARLSELTMERELVFSRTKEIQAKIRSQREFRDQESVDGVSSQSMTSNPIIGKLRGQLAELHTERQALLLNHHTVRAPEVVAIDGSLAAVQAQLAEALTESVALDPAIALLEAELAGLLERQRALSEAIDRTQQAGSTYPDLRRRFSKLQLRAAAAEEVYRSLQDQRYQIGVAESMTVSDIRVTAPARIPTDASSPKTLLNLLAGLLLGLSFGCVSAFATEYVDDTVQAAEDVRTVWDLPQLGALPRYATSSVPAMASLPPTDPLAEAHRALRNGIDFASLDKPVQLLGVTSSIPGEGKSTIAVNLAISLANDGRRVLLIDADLRLPTQHRHFPELVATPGLVEVLSRSRAVADVIQPTPVTNLWVLAAGTLPPNPAHLVESLRMRQVLLELGRSYDIVVIDTPPVLAVNDAVVLGRLVDGLVIVVEAHKASRRMLTEVRSRLEAARVQPLGFALNKVRAAAYPYGQYARYYQQAKATRPAPPAADRQGGAA